MLLGAYVEGPGTIVKTVNGGKTELINFTAALAINSTGIPVILNEGSDVSAVCGLIETADYPVVIREITDHTEDLLLTQLHEDRCLDGYIGQCAANKQN